MESSKEIHETMILETKMSKKKKSMCWLKIVRETYLKYCPMLIFWNFKVDYSYCQNLNLKTDFLAYELVNLEIKLSRVYETST